MLRGIAHEVRLNRVFLFLIIANQHRMEGKFQAGLVFLVFAAVTAFLDVGED